MTKFHTHTKQQAKFYCGWKRTNVLHIEMLFVEKFSTFVGSPQNFFTSPPEFRAVLFFFQIFWSCAYHIHRYITDRVDSAQSNNLRISNRRFSPKGFSGLGHMRPCVWAVVNFSELQKSVRRGGLFWYLELCCSLHIIVFKTYSKHPQGIRRQFSSWTLCV